MFPPISDDVLRRFDVQAPRYTSYPTVPHWTESFGPVDYARALQAASQDVTRPLSLYVHVPFCKEMCSYCGCHVIVGQSRDKASAYLEVVRRELALVAGHLGARRTLARLHWGGGTPTFLDEEQLSTLWGSITDVFRFSDDAEIALEIDPVVTTPGQLALLRGFGFNRLSMGVQDLDPQVQRAVNRVQTYEETRDTVDYARSLGFRSVNLDLIYGLPMQTPTSWRATMTRVAELRPDRIALFSFAHVPTVKPHQRRLPVHAMPTPAGKIELFRHAHDVLVDAGYRWIGMDHFALPDDELAVAAERHELWRDFQGYTVKRGGDSVGVGVSSISQVGDCFAQNIKTLPRHATFVGAGSLPIDQGFRLSEDDRRRREVITQLMCNFRVDLGEQAATEWGPELDSLRALERDGLTTVDGGLVTLTALGRVFVRNVAMVFDAYLAAAEPGIAYSRTV